jgi:glycosyltransferase involved in cell wall biosynthesis
MAEPSISKIINKEFVNMLSVIIPTYNRNDLLERCLNQLHADNQILHHSIYEVIVTDDSKDFRAKNLIDEKFPWVKHVKGLQKGPAANRNNGAKYASGDWLIFLDDDCLPLENWLLAYSDAIKSKKGRVYEGLTDADLPQERYNQEAPINLTGGNLWSCNFSINKEFFFSINGFDENFPYPVMEDVDLCTRIKRITEIIFIPEAKVLHSWRTVKPFKSYKRRLESYKYYVKKHQEVSFAFRFSRFKILIGDLFFPIKKLWSFSFRGISYYFETLLFDFIIIFV